MVIQVPGKVEYNIQGYELGKAMYRCSLTPGPAIFVEREINEFERYKDAVIVQLLKSGFPACNCFTVKILRLPCGWPELELCA